MEEVRNCLIVARKEYTNILVDLLYRPIYQGVKSIWDESKRTVPPRLVYGEFQRRLEKIPKWNQNTITKEYNRIVDKTKCEYLDELIKKVFVLHTQLLATHSSDPNRKIKLNVPKTDDFIHRCYHYSGEAFFENPVLLEDRPGILNGHKRIKNLENANMTIKESIQLTIRSMLPVGNLLQEDKDQGDGEDISPSPELYQRISAFNDMYKHDTKPSLNSFSTQVPSFNAPAENSQNLSPEPHLEKPITSYPTLSSILQKANTNTHEENKDIREEEERKSEPEEYIPRSSRPKFDVDAMFNTPDYPADDERASSEDEKEPEYRNSEQVKKIYLGKPLSRSVSRMDPSRLDKYKQNRDYVSNDSDSDAERKDRSHHIDQETSITNVDPLPSKNIQREDIDLDVNSATDEIPIYNPNEAREKQSTDLETNKPPVPPIEQFDTANFFSDVE